MKCLLALSFLASLVSSTEIIMNYEFTCERSAKWDFEIKLFEWDALSSNDLISVVKGSGTGNKVIDGKLIGSLENDGWDILGRYEFIAWVWHNCGTDDKGKNVRYRLEGFDCDVDHESCEMYFKVKLQ